MGILSIDRPHVEFDGSFAFSEDDIWFSDGCFLNHYNGYDFERVYECDWSDGLYGKYKHVWGISRENVFFYGNHGKILHYNGFDFTEMDSGSDVNLFNMAGTPDGEHVFACGWTNGNGIHESIVLELIDDTWETIYFVETLEPLEGTYGGVSSVSVCGDTAYFTTMAGLWKYNFVDTTSVLISHTDPGFSFLFRTFENNFCNGYNDLFLIGRDFAIFHYNGITWDFNFQFMILNGVSNPYAKGADAKNNNLAIGGYCNGGSQAIIARGFRNE